MLISTPGRALGVKKLTPFPEFIVLIFWSYVLNHIVSRFLRFINFYQNTFKPKTLGVVPRFPLILFIALFINFSLTILFLPTNSLSTETTNKSPLPQQSLYTLTWEELIKYATAYHLQLIDFASFSNSDKRYQIHEKSLNDRNEFIQFIIREFRNVAIFNNNEEKDKVYILPEGVRDPVIIKNFPKYGG